MEVFHRLELAMLHNRAQPARQIGDDVWLLILAKMSNRDVARMKVGCRYFDALARTRAPLVGPCEEDARLLVDMAPFARSSPVREALRQFRLALLVCVHCGVRDANHQMLALPDCGHPVCAECWTDEADDLSDSLERTTSGEHVWSNFYMKCGACGCRNEMDTGDWRHNDWSMCMHTLEGRGLHKLLRLNHVVPSSDSDSDPDVVAASEEEEASDEANEVAQRVTQLADRFRRLARFVLNRYGNKVVARAVRRELRAGVTWLERATGAKQAPRRPGRFAWVCK